MNININKYKYIIIYIYTYYLIYDLTIYASLEWNVRNTALAPFFITPSTSPNPFYNPSNS